MNEAVDAWATERPRLVGLAYRILGTVGDADDVVQDVGLTWLTVDHASIVNPAAFLTTLVSRRSIDRLRSAAVARTTYATRHVARSLARIASLGSSRTSCVGVRIRRCTDPYS
jgi:DNA-directed RNA polymerase specialized sigma24 family protein